MPDTSGSSVPEAARAAKAESDARLDRWFGAYCEAKALGGSGRAGLYRLMALADAEVAAAVAEERATTGRRIEAVEQLAQSWIDSGIVCVYESAVEMGGLVMDALNLRAALASPGHDEKREALQLEALSRGHLMDDISADAALASPGEES